MEIKEALYYDESIKKKVFKAHDNTYILYPESTTPPIMGAFGTVYIAYKPDKKMDVAIKQISKNGKMSYENIKLELQISEQFAQCHHIVKTLFTAEDANNFYIVMKNYNCETLTTLIKRGIIESEQMAVEFLRQICYGLMQLHSKMYMHRDIKSDNILAHRNPGESMYDLALCDFTTTKIYKDGFAQTQNIGSCITRAPEVHRSHYDFKADIYSIGCVLYKMLTGYDIINKFTEQEILNAQDKLDMFHVESRFGKLSQLTKSILEGCLKYSACNRISNNELFELLKLDTLIAENYKPLDLGNKVNGNTLLLQTSHTKTNYSPTSMNIPQVSETTPHKLTAKSPLIELSPTLTTTTESSPCKFLQNITSKEDINALNVISNELQTILQHCPGNKIQPNKATLFDLFKIASSIVNEYMAHQDIQFKYNINIKRLFGVISTIAQLLSKYPPLPLPPVNQRGKSLSIASQSKSPKVINYRNGHKTMVKPSGSILRNIIDKKSAFKKIN